MKRILSLAVVLVATASMAASAAAADWSSSVGKASVKPGDECAIVVAPASGKAWSVLKSRPSSWSDGSSYRSRSMLSFGPSKAKPSCGGGGWLACGQWVYLGPGYPYPWIWFPC